MSFIVILETVGVHSGAIFLSPPVPSYAFSCLGRQTFNALSFFRGRSRRRRARFGFGVDAAQIAPPLSYEFSGGGIVETKSHWYRARAADCASVGRAGGG